MSLDTRASFLSAPLVKKLFSGAGISQRRKILTSQNERTFQAGLFDPYGRTD
jgi:hypothetical protein